MSDHFRVRSISLRSIRGIYFRKGTRTWRVDRVSYIFSSVNGSRHLTLKINGASLHIAKDDHQNIKPTPRKHNRNLTLADLNPSPLARHAWSVISAITNYLEPFFRPLLRTYVIALLRIAIQWLPKITQALSFELESISVTLEDLPGAKLTAEEIRLHTALSLINLDQTPEPKQAEQSISPPDIQPGYGVGVWKKRMAESFQRSLDKALGESRGTVTMSLEICKILGTMPRPSQTSSPNVPFLLSPGTINFGISAKFNPKKGALETHGLAISLKMGDCSAKVDLINILLDKMVPKASQTVPIILPPLSPPFLSPITSLSSSFPLQSAAIPSSAQSFASTLFSPTSMMSAKASPLSQTFTRPMLPRLPKTPSSPFFKAISASIRPRNRFLVQSPTKLNAFKDKSKLMALHSIQMSVASINLSVLSETDSDDYRALISDITIDVSISDPTHNQLHKTHLGSREKTDVYDSNAYTLSLTLRRITFERETQHHTTRLARIGTIDLQILTIHWPTPFLSPTTFIGSDANSPFLAIHFKLESIHLTDRITDLQELMSSIPTKQKYKLEEPISPMTPSVRMTSFPIPRLSIGLECGPIIATIIYDADKGEKHRAIELRNNGCTLSLNAGYIQPSLAIGLFFPAASSVQALQWKSTLSVNLEPVLIRVRSNNFGGDALRVSHEDFLDDPPLLSIGAVELSAVANGVAQMDGAAESMAIIDLSTLTIESSLAFESVCIELWHPISVEAALRLLLLAPLNQENTPPTSSPPLFSKLPSGLSANASVGHFVIVITAPDISPNDNLDLSKGFALRTSISLEYCSLRPNQVHWFDNPHRSQQRAKLGLPPEALTDALGAAKAFAHPGNRSAFLKVWLNKLVLRAAVATQYEPDEPAIVGRDDIADRSQDILRIDKSQIDICISCKPSVNRLQSTDYCEISGNIPLISFDFQLSYVYHILLGLQTIHLLHPPRPPHSPILVDETKPNIILALQANVAAIQGTVALPSQRLVVRIDGVEGQGTSSDTPKIKWKRAVVLTSLPPNSNRWEEAEEGKWDEIMALQGWVISFTRLAGSLCMSVDADSGRIRIPHGFVLADLVQDASVSAKAIKHMSHMTSAGCFSEMPPPESEGAKSVPNLTIRLGCLCVEAQDDPFEANLGLIWKTGAEAVKQRMDREAAFKAKVAAVVSANSEQSSTKPTLKTDPETEYQFDSKHSVSVDEARKRLDDVHALDWNLRLARSKILRAKDEDSVLNRLYGTSIPVASDPFLSSMKLPNASSNPPLFRAMFQDLCLTISPPSFNIDHIADILYNLGGGLPRDTKFSLLVPLHIHFTLTALDVTLRDYPLPLFSISPKSSSSISWKFDTDLIVAEEMGTKSSIDWVTCPIIKKSQSPLGEAAFSIMVPKTIMPVKTYASPIIKVTTPEPTTLAWGVSYGPAIQDLMRIVETLSSLPRDPSPAIGFWDKMRLVFHWTVKVTFVGDVRLYIKGSRDPYETFDAGSGFVLCWQGNPEIRVGYENQQRELVQVNSEGMLIAVPNLRNGLPPRTGNPFQKVCARLTSGVRYGIGFILERACGPECLYCTGTPFHRKCRYFSFRPHYEVKLEMKSLTPSLKAVDDSYNAFRSDFIHLSVSLASSLKTKGQKMSLKPSNLYLTPKIFAHFWSWCSLFDGVLTLPIRQGNYHPLRPLSPKLGRHLATLKYRISLPHLYILHGYIDDARETWVDGVTPWVGLKGKVDGFQADMHQREEETTVPGPIPNTTRIVRRKPFYAAEVTMKGIELRAMLATFPEPMRQNAEMTAPPQRSNYRKHTDLPITPSTSIWYDQDDFVELDWLNTEQPILHLLPLASCPHFTFYKRNEALSGSHPKTSKFGSEHSHVCLLGKEPSVPKTQISLVSARAMELRQVASNFSTDTTKGSNAMNRESVMKMVTLLEEYIAVLKEVEIKPESTNEQTTQSYHMPADIVSSDEWGEFDNVYQIHCPSIFMDSAVRDIMMQYYYCSRDRRGFEYHMATRAVKFIRDQANVALASEKQEEIVKDRTPTNTAQLAASALRKMLKGEYNTKISVDVVHDKNTEPPGKIDPLDGWAEGVSLQKSHFCLLLKPQIVLRGETSLDTCVVAAAQAKLQSFAIMDLLNLDDPVSGKVMSRNYTSLSGLQAFSPTIVEASWSTYGSVPLEVLIDLRCQSDAFERLVPQTEATFHYDKFNRLRLRNNTTSIVTRVSVDAQHSTVISDSHLQDQTDLIRVHIPRFTVSANADHFQAISNIVTKLLLFSDPAHKTRLDKLETLIFTYDFTDLASAATVVSNLQGRLRDASETERLTRRSSRRDDKDARLGLVQLKAHIFLLAEELNLLFDSIKMTQDRFDDQTDQKSALLLHASSSEISWRMLDGRRNLLSKLVVSNINFHWLSRQDSSTVNHLAIGNLSAFDASRYAIWAEILSKYDQPPNHPLLKRGLFLLANWTVLAPVGGITIYEAFELSLHPLRLQIDAKVGHRIMEYVWPDRKDRLAPLADSPVYDPFANDIALKNSTPGRSSIDSPRALHTPNRPMDPGAKVPGPVLRKLGSSRSFTDLRSARNTTTMSPPPSNPSNFLSPPAFLKRTHSTDSIHFSSMLDTSTTPGPSSSPFETEGVNVPENSGNDAGDAQVMKTRSSQKSFVLVRISSLHLLLSVVKEGSFECHDAKIKTRELEYRNQTWSFEELVNQFIPSNMSWRGWVKMAFHQPLVPVLPVARELLAKTKWTTSSKSNQPHDNPLRLLHPRILAIDDDRRLNSMQVETLKKVDTASKSAWQTAMRSNKDPQPRASIPLTDEPESMDSDQTNNSESPPGRKRVKSLFSSGRQSSKSRGPDKRNSEDLLKGTS